MRALRIGCLAALLALVAFAASARTLLRDPDIEYALKKLAEPIVGVSGMSIGRIDIMVIHDDRMNAFIVDDRTVFIHSGLILRLGSAAELQSVIAHEIAHIANGHIPRRAGNRRAAGRSAFAGMALGLAAALAGDPSAGAGLALGALSGDLVTAAGGAGAGALFVLTVAPTELRIISWQKRVTATGSTLRVVDALGTRHRPGGRPVSR